MKYMKIGYYGYMHVPNNKGKMKNNGSRLQFQHKLYTIKTCIYKKLHKKSLNAITLDNWIFFLYFDGNSCLFNGKIINNLFIKKKI